MPTESSILCYQLTDYNSFWLLQHICWRYRRVLIESFESIYSHQPFSDATCRRSIGTSITIDVWSVKDLSRSPDSQVCSSCQLVAFCIWFCFWTFTSIVPSKIWESGNQGDSERLEHKVKDSADTKESHWFYGWKIFYLWPLQITTCFFW